MNSLFPLRQIRCHVFFLFCLSLIFSCKPPDTTSLSVTNSSFIDNLMKQMTIEEKIGQLNLLTPGGAMTGEVVSKDEL